MIYSDFLQMSPRRKRLVIAASGAFAACLVLPGVGPLLRHDLQTAGKAAVTISPSDTGGEVEADYAAREAKRQARFPQDQSAAATMPNDFAVQLALCERSVPFDKPKARFDADDEGDVPLPAGVVGRREKIAHKLVSLAPQFGGEPAFCAAVLRNLSSGAVNLSNRHEGDFLQSSASQRLVAQNPTPDPTNENLAIWHNAAQAGERLEPKNAFFPIMEAVGSFAQHRDTDAKTALLRASRKPDYNDYLSDALSGTVRLNQAEETQTGLSRLMTQISQTGPHYAALANMSRLATAEAINAEQNKRVEDGFVLRQALRRVGANIRENSSTWFGMHMGETLIEKSALRPGGVAQIKANDDKADTAAYQTYLRSIGHADEADAVLFEARENAANKQLYRQVQDNPAYFMNISRLLRLAILPVAVLLLLANALVLLLSGGLASRLARTAGIANGTGVPRFAGAVGLLGTSAAICTFALIGTILGRAATGPLQALGNVAHDLEAPSSVLAVFIAPLALLLLAACSPKAGVPMSVGMVRGMRGLAVPLACVLILISVPLTVWSAWDNAALCRDLSRASVHEGRYIAEISGKTWPLHSRKPESPRP